MIYVREKGDQTIGMTICRMWSDILRVNDSGKVLYVVEQVHISTRGEIK